MEKWILSKSICVGSRLTEANIFRISYCTYQCNTTIVVRLKTPVGIASSAKPSAFNIFVRFIRNNSNSSPFDAGEYRKYWIRRPSRRHVRDHRGTVPKRFRLVPFAIVYFKQSPLQSGNSRVPVLKNPGFPTTKFHIRLVNTLRPPCTWCTYAGFYNWQKSRVLPPKPRR